MLIYRGWYRLSILQSLCVIRCGSAPGTLAPILMRHQEQGPVFITVYPRGDRTVPLLIEGIINPNVIEEFLPVRDDLPVDRVPLLPDKGPEIGIDPHRIFFDDPVNLLLFEIKLCGHLIPFDQA